MNTESYSQPANLPSRRTLLLTTLGAMAVAAVIVVTAVLPVDYNLDPLGTGKTLGLLRTPPVVETPTSSAVATAALQPLQVGDVGLYGSPYRTDTIQFVIEPYDFIEYKYHLAKGAGMAFAWKASASVRHDFHGEPDENPDDVVSYDESEKDGANGSFVAPMTGIHGWFWENTGPEAVRVKVVSSGFYTYSMEFHADGSKNRHELDPVNPVPKETK